MKGYTFFETFLYCVDHSIPSSSWRMCTLLSLHCNTVLRVNAAFQETFYTKKIVSDRRCGTAQLLIVFPFPSDDQIQCLMCCLYMNFGTLVAGTRTLYVQQETHIDPQLILHTLFPCNEQFYIIKGDWMDACFWYTYIHSHTRAFKVETMKSAKRFNLNKCVLTELGYVYICYSILKPSRYLAHPHIP